MKKTLLSIVALALIGVGAWYFLQLTSSSTRLGKLVPAESNIVINLDLNSLLKKADLANVEKRVFVQTLIQKHGDTATQHVLGQLLKDPHSSGVRFKDQAFFFFNNDKQTNNAGLLLGLNSDKDFESMILKIEPGASVQKEEELSYWIMPEGAVLIWNAKTALLYKDMDSPANIENARRILAGDVPSIHQKKLFKDAYVKGHDAHIFIDYTKLSKATESSLEALKLEGGVGYGVGCSFVDGEIKLENKVAFESSKDAKWMGLYRHKSGTHYLDYTSNEIPLGAFQVTLNTDHLFEMLMENNSTREGLEEIAGQLGAESGDVLAMFTGTVAFSFSGVETRVEKRNFFGTETEEEVTFPKGAIFIGVKDHELFQKWLDKSNQSPENGKYRFDIPFLGTFFLVKTEAGISIMMLEPMADQLAANKSFGITDYGETGKYLKAHANSVYLNLDLETMPLSFTNYLKQEYENYSLIESTLKPLHHIQARQDQKRGFAKIVFKNKEQNALIELLDLADAVYLKYEEEKVEVEEEVEEVEEMLKLPEPVQAD